MDCWEILGIRKTEDQEEIRKAYYKQLPHFHPEENPEGFRALKTYLSGPVENTGLCFRVSGSGDPEGGRMGSARFSDESFPYTS